MKLHLPLFLRKSVLSCIAFAAACTLSSGSLALADDLVLGAGDNLSIDYAAGESIPNLDYGTLQLEGDTLLQLLNCGMGDGKTYTLATGVSGLLDAQGNAISLDDTNNAISNYFDASQPGTGFWADGTLQLTDAGTLQLVLHNETVKEAITITTHQSNPSVYQYYAGIAFAANGGAIFGFESIITLSDNGSVTFIGNTAESSSSDAYGGAIYGFDNTTITLSDNGSVTFNGNTAESSSYDACGGAIYGDYYSTITLSDNGSVTFSGNTVSSSSLSSIYYADGGAIYGDHSSPITLSNNGSVTFIGNTAGIGGAIFGGVTMTGNGDVTFSGNMASITSFSSRGGGGAIYGGVTMEGNGDVTFSGNTASGSIKAFGGAIYAGVESSIVSVSASKGGVCFAENKALAAADALQAISAGGAIYGGNATRISFSSNEGGVMLRENQISTVTNTTDSSTDVQKSHAYGGAIFGDRQSHLNVDGNLAGVVISGNKAVSAGEKSASVSGDGANVESCAYLDSYAFGGALYGAQDSVIRIGDNAGGVELDNNVASASAKAFSWAWQKGAPDLYAKATATAAAYSHGGAVAGDAGSVIEIVGNRGEVSISGNSAVAHSDTRVESYHVDISSAGDYTILNGVRVARAYGGAIYGGSGSDINICGNAGGLAITGNSVESTHSGWNLYGVHVESGLPYEPTLGLCAYVETLALGGAIYSEGSVAIRNNGDVLFSGNYERSSYASIAYQLRSIYLNSSSEDAAFHLSAAAGNSITFEDSVYVASGADNGTVDVVFNSSYTDAFGTPVAQTGDIVFTGAATVESLYKAKGNVNGTKQEILASRTSEVNAMTNLYGGRLRVEDGAIYQGQGITVHEGSKATVRVKDAELSHVGYDLTFNDGTALEVAGESTIRGQVNLQEGSVFKLELGAVLCLHETAGSDAATLTVNGSALLSGSATLNAGLTLADGATLDMDYLDAGAVTLNGALTFGEQVTIGENLLALLEDIKTQAEGVALFTGIDSLTLPQTATTTTSGRVWAGVVFSNLASNQNYYLVYQADTGTLSIVYNVPEPATATLSLLALAALAARRRRK